jgi:hypothetical protein
MEDNDQRAKDSRTEGHRIASPELAAIIVDALKDAGIVSQQDVRRAIAIAAEEIEVRRALGDLR